MRLGHMTLLNFRVKNQRGTKIRLLTPCSDKGFGKKRMEHSEPM